MAFPVKWTKEVVVRLRSRLRLLLLATLLLSTVILWSQRNILVKDDAPIQILESATFNKSVLHPRTHRVTYYSRHTATLYNFEYISRGLNLTLHYISPTFLTRHPSEMTAKRALEIVRSGYVHSICSSTDIIVFADTAVDARPFLTALANDIPCSAKIVMELTNRVDWGVPADDLEEYWSLLGKTHTKVTWIANNPYDAKYIQKRIPASVKVIRSSGISRVPKQIIPSNETTFAVTNARNWTRIYKEMSNMEIPVLAKKYYGGPETLTQHLGYIDFPYQVSTMKLYENLRAGVTLYVPSKKFFRNLVESKTIGFCCWDQFRNAETGKVDSDWHMNVEYYRPEFRRFVVYFGSLVELKGLLEKARSQNQMSQASVQIRKEGMETMEKMGKESIKEWRLVLN